MKASGLRFPVILKTDSTLSAKNAHTHALIIINLASDLELIIAQHQQALM